MPHRLPSDLTNRECWDPAAMAVTPLATICSGRFVLLEVPSPNCPELFRPMAQRLPSDLRNRLWLSPQAIATTPLDTYPDVGDTSLAVAGGRIYWTSAGAPRTAVP